MRELIILFIRIGFTAFGGPAAHIAMLEQEVVNRKKWMDHSHFLDLVAVTNLIPGPNSTEMVMHIGYHRAGWRGLIVAGLMFILPACSITLLLAWMYAQWGTLPEAQPALNGIKPAVLAVIFWAMLRFGQKTIINRQRVFIAFVVVIAAILGLNEVLAILSAGLLGIFLHAEGKIPKGQLGKHGMFPLPLPLAVAAVGGTATVLKYSLAKLAFVFFKTGCVLFGSGYVLFAFLEPDLVTKYAWLTREQLLDAIAVGQFTPGPVLSASTFVGYQIDGLLGAVTASVCIFLPSFFFVAICNPLIPKLRKSENASAFLDGAKSGAVALILVVLIRLSISTLTTPIPIGICLVAILLLWWKPKLNTVWIILGGGLAGLLLHQIPGA